MIANVQESNNSLKFAIDVNNCMLDSMWKKTYIYIQYINMYKI
jgi:hypothetical protein